MVLKDSAIFSIFTPIILFFIQETEDQLGYIMNINSDYSSSHKNCCFESWTLFFVLYQFYIKQYSDIRVNSIKGPIMSINHMLK
jgi:hypothetical protein